jgi:hypothetical protein
MGMSGVRNFKARAALLVVGLLATLLVLALSACGGAGAGGKEEAKGEEAKGRPLPDAFLHPKALRPGEYHSVKFKPPLSLKVSKGWENAAEELPAFIELGYEGGTGGVNDLSFANVKEVYKPGGLGDVVEAPKDLVGWLQHHPDLKTSKPQPVTLGGVKGEQFEVVVKDLPKDYYSLSCPDCVDIAPLSNDQAAAYFREVNKRKVIVLEDVKGDTVMIWFAAPPDEFEEFAPEAQKVVDSVKWSGS